MKNIDIIIEIPLNSNIKYEYDKKEKRMRCDRILSLSMVYPGNYGYIPNTLANDGDALDVLLVNDYPLYPGTIVECKFIGVLIMSDEAGLDEKIIAVPSESVDKNYVNVNEIFDISKNKQERIKYFFNHYKDIDNNKWSEIKELKNREYAYKLYEKYKLK